MLDDETASYSDDHESAQDAIVRTSSYKIVNNVYFIGMCYFLININLSIIDFVVYLMLSIDYRLTMTRGEGPEGRERKFHQEIKKRLSVKTKNDCPLQKKFNR